LKFAPLVTLVTVHGRCLH